jgi:hypothetical protein
MTASAIGERETKRTLAVTLQLEQGQCHAYEVEMRTAEELAPTVLVLGWCMNGRARPRRRQNRIRIRAEHRTDWRVELTQSQCLRDRNGHAIYVAVIASPTVEVQSGWRMRQNEEVK